MQPRIHVRNLRRQHSVSIATDLTGIGNGMAPVSTSTTREERVRTARPVHLDQGTGITRDVSASGVFFETDVDYAAGSEISFSIELEGPGGKMMLRCQGQIVRVEQRDGKVGVAAKIIESRLEPVQEVT